MSIPVIDIFAGPGGLGEGFSSVLNDNGERVFKTVLSIEMDIYAHQTLELRSLFRQFSPSAVPDEYYCFLRSELSRQILFEHFPIEAEAARNEAWHAKLGYENDCAASDEVDSRINKALKGEKNWILLGGPPCQAYSIVGRSRLKRKILNPIIDHRVELYKQYLRILAYHNPLVFVMENVKGILSSKTEKVNVFEKILSDIKDPVAACKEENKSENKFLECPGYDIYPLAPSNKHGETLKPTDFVIRSEQFGIPQARHRVIIIGIRKKTGLRFKKISPSKSEIAVSQVLNGLPELRSGISRGVVDNAENWFEIISKAPSQQFFKSIDTKVADLIKKIALNGFQGKYERGSDFIETDKVSIDYPDKEWFLDDKMAGVANHNARSHMKSDLYRYLFVSAYGAVHGMSPTLSDFPDELLPKHKNVLDGIIQKKFADRFRVQISTVPSRTITSHISKDGHYYIHPDPKQCRSLTVREAARIQTFPDNYFFCGPRTSQYVQVGNAVPPLLAKKIANHIKNILEEHNGETT